MIPKAAWETADAVVVHPLGDALPAEGEAYILNSYFDIQFLTEGVQEVNRNIEQIYKRRRAAAYALCVYYGALALQLFKQQQANSQYWTNRTGIARDTVFSGAYKTDDEVGWYLAHMMQYGVYLELANDRQNESIRPILERYAGRFISDLKKIYGDTSATFATREWSERTKVDGKNVDTRYSDVFIGDES
jgi:hypothetical protein